MKRSLRLFSLFTAFFVALLASAAIADTHWKTDLLQWRAQRAEKLTAPEG
jgi:hypothetical protein